MVWYQNGKYGQHETNTRHIAIAIAKSLSLSLSFGQRST